VARLDAPTGNSQTSTGYIFSTDYKLDGAGKPA
jgi:hypothetical protein